MALDTVGRPMKMKTITAIFLTLGVSLAIWATKPQDNYVPEEGYVPSEDVAIRIAVAVWEPIYGADKIAKEKPFHAKLADGVWTVEGSLPEGAKGGVALAKISKADGRIIRVIHGK
jgi:NTF2 fold immunity protein